MGNKRDDFAWIVELWEDLGIKDNKNRTADPRYNEQTTSYDYVQWKKRERRNYSMWIIYVVLIALSIIIPALLH